MRRPSREIIETKLTRLFSSQKDGDRTKIGKFGIGFVSVFAIGPDVVAARLVAEGIGPAEATTAARAAHGDLERARVLATDPALAERRDAFAGAPHRLDGSGAAAFAVAAKRRKTASSS